MFSPLLILLGKEHQMMPGQFFVYFASNKTACLNFLRLGFITAHCCDN